MRVRQIPYAVATRLGLAALARRRDAAPVLCYHNVVPDDAVHGAGEPSLHLAASDFRAQMELLRRHYDVVSLSAIVSALEAGRSLRGLAAVTFDDAYRGVLRHALPVLRDFGLPTTLFVVSGWAAHPQAFWWDVLAASGRTDPSTHDTAMRRYAGRTADVLAGLGPSPLPQLPDDSLAASWEELRAQLGPLVAVGAHTVGHPNLAALPRDEVERELFGAKRQITHELGRPPEILAYPYGAERPDVRSLAEAAGYRAALSMMPGTVTHRSPRFALPRVNVPATISLPAFECWSAGWRP